ncbi:hypothetical protein FB451DRAFT_1376103 [Mycena latifolia]|nr:hypothetical protein FB451DRAFT_1376103 [Mycena latifolia]
MGDRRRGIRGLRRGTQVLQCIWVPAGQPYWQVFLMQGVGLGVGLGFTFLPAHHFARWRGLSIGLMTSGASIGGIVFSLVLNRLLFTHGFVVGIRATAGLVTASCCLLICARYPPTHAPRTWCSYSPGLWSCSGCSTSSSTYSCTQSRAASVRSIRAQLAFDTVSVLNTGSSVGRLLPPLLADRAGSFMVLIPMTILAAACVLCMFAPAAAEQGVVAIALVYGTLNAAFASLTPALLAELSTDRNEVGLRMGVCITHPAMTPRATRSAPLHLWHWLWEMVHGSLIPLNQHLRALIATYHVHIASPVVKLSDLERTGGGTYSNGLLRAEGWAVPPVCLLRPSSSRTGSAGAWWTRLELAAPSHGRPCCGIHANPPCKPREGSGLFPGNASHHVS